MGRSSIDGVMVEPWTCPEVRSGVCLCSHASLDCLLNRIYFQVWLAFFTSVALYTLPCSPVTIDFAGIYSLVFWCFKPFFTSTDPFSSILSLENRTVAKEKEVQRIIHSFILQTQTHADPYQRKISHGLCAQLSSDFICRAMQLDMPSRALFWIVSSYKGTQPWKENMFDRSTSHGQRLSYCRCKAIE